MMTKVILCTLSRPIPIFSGIWFYIYFNHFFLNKKATQGINLIIDSRVAKLTDANYTITNSWKTLQIAIIFHALHDIMTSQCRKWDFFFIKKDKTGRCVISIDIMQSCPHIFILFFFAPSLFRNVPMFVFSPTCIRFLSMINAMINQQLIIVTRAVFLELARIVLLSVPWFPFTCITLKRYT